MVIVPLNVRSPPAATRTVPAPVQLAPSSKRCPALISIAPFAPALSTPEVVLAAARGAQLPDWMSTVPVLWKAMGLLMTVSSVATVLTNVPALLIVPPPSD